MSMDFPPSFKGHVVAVPFPTRDHVNTMINLCKSLSSKLPNEVIITVVVTQELVSLVQSYPMLHNIRYTTVPRLFPMDSIPKDDVVFSEHLSTKMRLAFEYLLYQLEPPITAVISDIELGWPAIIAKQMNISVALLWTLSASFFETLRQLYILTRDPSLSLDEKVRVLSSSQFNDIQELLVERENHYFLKITLNLVFLQMNALMNISGLAKADYLLLNTIQELEDEQINYLKSTPGFSFQVCPVGPAIPFMELGSPPNDSSINNNDDPIMKWLDCQPNLSVLYISMGGSMSLPQMEELASALKSSGTRFLWMGGSDAEWLKETCGDKGLVVPWCDQLKVLCHSSIAGFWSNCKWNSTLEACFGGVPILGFPIFLDQFSNCRLIAEVWKNGWKVGGERSEDLVTKDEILKVVEMVMDVENEEVKRTREKAKELKTLLHGAIAKGGSSDMNMDAFVKDMF